jgi:DNA-binding NtrC family response regulator
MVRTERLDLVLTDYYLKGSTGGALARLIKKAQPQLPVAIYSGAADVPDDVRYADVFLAKAGGPGALIDSLRRLAKPREQAA